MTVRLFISHSSKDVSIVKPLLVLLKEGLRLSSAEIRCTSVPGYKLPGGADTEEALRSEVNNVDAFIGVISPASLRSLYVAFELGARWGVKKHLLPVLAPGVGASVLSGPLEAINALRCDSRAELQQMVEDLSDVLGIQPEKPAALNDAIDAVLATAEIAKADESTVAPEREMFFATREAIRIEPADHTIISDDQIEAIPVIPGAIDLIRDEAARILNSSFAELVIDVRPNGGTLIMHVPVLRHEWQVLSFSYHRPNKKEFGLGFPIHIEEYLSGDDKAVHEIEDEQHLKTFLREIFSSESAKLKITKLLQAAKSRVAEKESAKKG